MYQKKLNAFFLSFVFLLAAFPVFASSYTRLILSVVINKQPTNDLVTVLETPDRQIWFDENDLQKWHFNLPASGYIVYENKHYFALNALENVTYSLDMARLEISINAPAGAFNAVTTSLPKNFVVPQKPALGAFLNYNLFRQQTDGNGSNAINNGLFTLNVYNAWGSLSNGLLASVPQGNANLQPNSSSLIRLNTTWQTDFPVTMNSFRLGDNYSSTGMFQEGSVNFGGIQWAKNFDTQPSYITFPLPSISGQAVTPSVVNLYQNNAMIASQQVHPGPFAINAIPVVTGAGTVNVVVTNLLGQQQIVSLPYYASSNLLQPGLQSYSFETGFIRENYGMNSNDYGPWMGSATDEIGITDALTVLGHAEMMSTQQTGNIGANYLIDKTGVLSVSGAVSHDTDGEGGLISVGFQHQENGGISYGFNIQSTTQKFTYLGLQPGQLAPILLGQFSVGIPVSNGSSLGMSYTQQNNRGLANMGFVNMSYNWSFYNTWNLSLTGITNVSGQSNKAAFLILSKAVGEQTSLSISNNFQTGNNQSTVQLSKGLPVGPGYGYNINASPVGSNQNYQVSGSVQNNVGTYTLGAARQNDVNGYQLQAQGGIAMINDGIFFSRALGNSFALVEVPDNPNVEVYYSNSPVGKTNSQGKLLVPGLLPYQNNRLSINPSDLPLSANIQAKAINVVPYNNTGLVAHFPVKMLNSALMTLHLASSQPVPMGAMVHVKGETKAFPVINDGETYVEGLKKGQNALIVDWDGKSTTCQVTYETGATPIPNLGVITCEP